MNSSPNITDLPLEVLILILKKLPSLRDQLRLALIHPHIESAFCCHSTQRVKEIDTCDLTVKEWSDVLQICGSSVKYITGIYMFNDAISKLVIQHCPSVQSVALKVTTANINAIKALLNNAKSLSSIFLYNDIIQPMGNHLGIIKLLKLQASLRMVHLMKFGGDELLEVRNLITLEDLKIIGCPDHFLNIHELCSSLKELRSLSIQSGSFTTSKEFEGVPCPALKSLHLHETFVFSTSTPDILKWILSHADTLEELQFNLTFGDASDQDACQILAKCKHLRYLDMKVENAGAGADFAHNVIKIVSENGVTSKERPLKLKFNNRIHDLIRQLKHRTSAEQLISLSYW